MSASLRGHARTAREFGHAQSTGPSRFGAHLHKAVASYWKHLLVPEQLVPYIS